MTHAALKDLIQFMYCGEVNVKQDALPTFISAAEALQIKGLTETGDTPAPPPPQPTHVPAKSSTHSTISTSPRPRAHQRPQRPQPAYRLESEDSSDDKPTVVLHQQPQKRIIQRSSITPQSAPKRLKTVTADPLEATETRQTQQTQQQQQPQQQTSQQSQQQTQAQQQVITVTASDAKSVGEPEFIDLPIEAVPTKAEPVYAEEGDDEAGDQEATYVEDDSYGDMKYDESYFTENDDKAAGSGFTESYTEGDTSATEAQG